MHVNERARRVGLGESGLQRLQQQQQQQQQQLVITGGPGGQLPRSVTLRGVVECCTVECCIV